MDPSEITSIAPTSSGENDSKFGAASPQNGELPLPGSLSCSPGMSSNTNSNSNSSSSSSSRINPGTCMEEVSDDDNSSADVTSTLRQYTSVQKSALLLLLLLVLGVVAIVIGLGREIESPAAPVRDESSHEEQDSVSPTKLGPLGCQAGLKLLVHSTTKTPYKSQAQHGSNYSWKLIDCASRVVAQCKRPCGENASTTLPSKDQHLDRCLLDGHSFTFEVHVDTKQSCCGFGMGSFALEYNGIYMTPGHADNFHLTQITRANPTKKDFVEGRDESRVWSIEIGKQVSPCLTVESAETSSPIGIRVPSSSPNNPVTTKSFTMTPVKSPSHKPSQLPSGHPPDKWVGITDTLSVPDSTIAPSKVSSAPPSKIPTKITSSAPIRGHSRPPSSLPLSEPLPQPDGLFTGEPDAISCPEAGNSIEIGGSSVTIFNAVAHSFCGIFIYSSFTGDLVSFVRSYNGYHWEASPGPKASRMDSILCRTLSCTIKLPELETGNSYVVLAKDGSMSTQKQVAKFLEMTTFGITKPELTRLSDSAWGEKTRAEYLRQQLDMEATSHREHFRRRANTKWPADKQSASTDHPCSPLSKWRRYTFIEADRVDVFDGAPNAFVFETVVGNTYHEIFEADSEQDVGCGECTNFNRTSFTGASNQAGYTFGGGGDYLEWYIDMSEDGAYSLSFHYSIGKGVTNRNRTLRLQVNGRTVRKRLRFENTKSWAKTTYSEYIIAELLAGKNSIRLSAETQGSGPFLDHIQIGKPPAVIIKSYGYARTVVKEGIPEMPSTSMTVTLPKLPSPPRGQFDKGSVVVSIEGSDRGVSLDAGNPSIDFSGHEHHLLPQGYFSFDSTHIFLNTTSELYDSPLPFGQEYLLRDGLEDPLCDSIPRTSSQRSPPVFGQRSDGTWLQWTPSLQLEANGPTIDAIDKSKSTLSDGGGEVEAESMNSVKCSNVPRTLFNEATCRLSYENSTCLPAENNSIDLRIHLTEDNILLLNDILSGFLYAVRDLRLDSLELHPCVVKHSRWLVTENATCPSPTLITTKTRDALNKAIGGGSGRQGNIRDAIRRIFMVCSDEDINLTTLKMQIQIEGDCFTHTHLNNYDVYDFSEWANRHPGGREAIAQFADIGSAWLDFPASHPMSRWGKLGGGTIKHVGTQDSKVDFRDLPSELKTSAVVREFGEEEEEEAGKRQASGPTIVCGSTSEVKNDPILGEAYEFVSTGEETSKKSELRAQKSDVWINAVISAKDQLRQRVAHALSTIMPSVPSDITGGDSTEKYTVYHDIFVRHAFGRYIDVLRDVSYSPIMGDQLSFKENKSRAYTYQKKRQLADADENFSREVMQLFSIGLVRLDDYGLPILDGTGQPLKTYTNEIIESLARSWTAFDMSVARGNVEGRSDSFSSVDPMVLHPEWRDVFPKIGMDDEYIGDRYVLCTEEPPRMFLRKGARYLLLGGSPLPHLLSDPVEVASEDVFAELDPTSHLFKALHNGGNRTSVELSTDLECTGIECMVDLFRVVKVDSVFYEWVPRPCTMLAFYNGKQIQTSDSSSNGQICANPDLPVAREACCRPDTREDVKQAKMVSGVTHLYEGERMTWARANDRCRDYGSSLCRFASLEVSPHDAKFRRGFHWTDQEECDILVKVDRDGRIAIVHDVRGATDVVPYHLNLDHTTNFFHVFWDESNQYPGEETSCSMLNCLPLEDGTCLCRTETKETAVFGSLFGITRDDIMSKLFIGTSGPGAGSSSMYVRDVIAHLVEGKVDEKTVFEVRNKDDEPIFLRNLVSSVSLAGWLMPPKKLEAEDATLFDSNVKTSSTASGGAFTQFRSSDEAYIEWEVNVPLAAEYTLSFRYALGSDPRDLSLLVNGQSTVFRFLPTGSWERHFLYTAPTAVYLKAGINFIRLQLTPRTNGVNIDLLRIEAKDDSSTSVAKPSFRNPPHFMSLLSDGNSKSELTRRDAQYETEAVLEHLFYHDNVAPFICGRMIQRFGISNPSPRYVKVCVDAFRSGSYESGGMEFGSGRYGCLEALISSIVLDREATDPAASFDSSFGSIREPLLRYIQLFRSMDYKASLPVSTKIDFPGDLQIRLASLPQKIGQGPHDHPSIFSFFLPTYVPGSGPLATSMLHSPESLMLTGPHTLQLLSGMHSLIKFGLSNCDGGFGLNPNIGRCKSSHGSYSGRLVYEPDGSTLLAQAQDLSLVLTAGRVNDIYLSKIVSACSAEPEVAQVICLQQLIVSTSEFHTTTETTPISSREVHEQVKIDRGALRSNPAAAAAYKAIVVLDLKGGVDSFNLLTPLSCAPIDVYENYRTIRGKTADEEGVGMPRSRLLEIPASNQPCESFGVHENLPLLKELYDKGEATFIANAGLLLKPTNNDSHRSDTPVNLFSHNDMANEMKKEDIRSQHFGTGVAGRIATALTEAGMQTDTFSIDGQQVLFSTAGRGPPQLTIGEDGLPDFNEGEESVPNEVLKSLNGPVTPSSGQFAQTWSMKMNEAISQYEKLKSLLDSAVATENFPTTRIAAELELVTKLMQSHQQRGAQRDVFYVSQLRYDTHQNVDERLVENFSELNAALEAFVEETKVLGLYESIVVLQFSEFGRTLSPNTNSGTDHAWGGNYFLIGGALNGGKVLGHYPAEFEHSKSNIALSRGRLVPTTPFDAVWMGTSEWFGVPLSQMEYVLPMNTNFSPGTLFSEEDLFTKS